MNWTCDANGKKLPIADIDGGGGGAGGGGEDELAISPLVLGVKRFYFAL